MKVEFIKAHEDGTWTTEVIDVPDEITKDIDFTSPQWDSAVIAYCHDSLASRTQYRKVVYWGIYNSEPEADAEVPKLIISQHTDPEDGRKDRDNLGRMVCWHGRYNLGDEQPGGDPREWERENVPKDSVSLNLYLLDHSGITMSCEDFNDQWDSGQVGIIFAPPEKIKEEYGDLSPESCEKARGVMRSEVKLYDQYLRGSVWGYEFGEDSCWDFPGDTLEETGIADHVPEEAKDQLEEAWENRSS